MSYNTGPATTYYAIPTMASGDVPALDTNGLTAILNAIDSALHAVASAVTGIPTGTIQMWAGASAPVSWLLCDGSAVSRTTYSALFAITGTSYGSGDGSTTFNLPDLRGRIPAGYAASGGHSDVSTLGNNEGSSLANRRPRHPHTNGLTLPNHAHSDTISFADSGHTHGLPNVLYAGNGAAESGNITPVSNYPANLTATNSGTASLTRSGSVGNPTSNPSISGTIGAAGTANDSPAYMVVNIIIKT